MTRLLLILSLVSLSLVIPAAALAQTGAPSPQDLRVLSLGGFLGQLDGFCEAPGGTYDCDAAKQPGVQPCATPAGTLPPTTQFPMTMGGLLGGRRLIDATRASAPTPLVLVTGNNQVANFAFLNRQVLSSNEKGQANLTPTSNADRLGQTQARFSRFWRYMDDLNADAIGMGAEDFVRSLRDPRESLTPRQVTDRGAILQEWIADVTRAGRGLPLIASNAVVRVRRKGTSDLNAVENGDVSLSGIDEDESADWLTKVTVRHPNRGGIGTQSDRARTDRGCRGPKAARHGDHNGTSRQEGRGGARGEDNRPEVERWWTEASLSIPGGGHSRRRHQSTVVPDPSGAHAPRFDGS